MNVYCHGKVILCNESDAVVLEDISLILQGQHPSKIARLDMKN